MSKTVIRKYDGGVLTADLENIHEAIDQMTLDDFNYNLMKINRHNGTFGNICNVYAHSAYMAEKVEMVCNKHKAFTLYDEAQKACLVHDFAEVFTGDIPKPAKDQFCRSVADSSEGESIREFEDIVSGIALKKYFNQENRQRDMVSCLDGTAVYAEALVFGGMKLFREYLEADGIDVASCDGSLFLLNIIEYSQGLEDFYNSVLDV